MKRLVISTLVAALMHSTACTAVIVYDVNKDVHNTTGQPAYGFKIVLKGEHGVVWHYDGYPDNWRFLEFVPPSVENAPEGKVTVLRWRQPLNPAGMSQPIPDCNWVHVGYRLDTPAEVLEACWTDSNGACLPVPEAQVDQPSQWGDVTDRTLTITIKNALRNGHTITVRVFGYRLWDGQMGLDRLNRNNPALAPSNFTPVPGVEGDITLAHNEVRTFQFGIPSSVPGTDWPSIILKKGDPKQELFVDLAQFHYAPFVPAVSRVGLVAMGALVLVAGMVVIARRPRHTPA